MIGNVKHLDSLSVQQRRKDPTRQVLTSVWIHELIAASANAHTSSVLLDELYNLVKVTQWQIVVLQETLRSSVGVLCGGKLADRRTLRSWTYAYR